MKKITKSLIAGAFALAFIAQPALADERHGHHEHYEHHWHGHDHDRYWYGPERVVYRPVPSYYYPAAPVAYYPPYYAPPVYQQPVTSFGFIIR